MYLYLPDVAMVSVTLHAVGSIDNYSEPDLPIEQFLDASVERKGNRKLINAGS